MHAVGVILTTLALLSTSLTVAAWTLRLVELTGVLGVFVLGLAPGLLAETLARSLVPPSSDFHATDRAIRSPTIRDAPVFLVVDLCCLALVALHTARVCGLVAFASDAFATALLLSWPAAIANWATRLVVETDAFADVASAVARKETMAMQHATRMRRLGGARCPPPDAGRFSRAWHGATAAFENVKTMALSGSGRAFRRAMLLCSLADWGLLLGVWAATGGASASARHHGGVGVSSSSAAMILLPVLAFLVVDSARLVAQLGHGALLTGARANRRGDAAEARARRKALMASRVLGRQVFGQSIPAGMTTRLTQSLYVANLANVALVLLAAAGSWLIGWFLGGDVAVRATTTTRRSAEYAVGLVGGTHLALGSGFAPVAGACLLARFARLVLELTYLASALLAKVDRSRFPVSRGSGALLRVAGAPPRGAGSDSDAFGRVATAMSRLDAASDRMDELIAGFGRTRDEAVVPAMEANSLGRAILRARERVAVAASGWRSSSGGGGTRGGETSPDSAWSVAGMTLPEFTEAISTGLRGHLVGERAEAAAAELFRECAGGDESADAIGLADIQRWLAAQPPLRARGDAAGVGVVGVGVGVGVGSGDGDDGESSDDDDDAYDEAAESERAWRRSVQRVLARFVRRAEYGRGAAARATRGETMSPAEGGEAAAEGGGGGGGLGLEGGGGVEAASNETLAPAKHLHFGASTMPGLGAGDAPRRGLRLLSLEGGGIKGLALIWQLRALERAAGRPIHELFDLVGGVSTGGIIALGISRGVPLEALERMYHEIGRKVFGTQSAVRQLLKGAAADNAAIHDLLVEYLGDLPMIDAPGQLVRCFVVTTQQTERLEVRLIRTYKHPSKGRDQSEEWSQWEAGMATSSAPTVFPPFVRRKPLPRTDDAEEGAEEAEPSTRATPSSASPLASGKNGAKDGERQVFVDGALSGYNNPSSLLLNEGLDLAEPGQQIDVLLSLGCGEVAAAGAGDVGANGDKGLVFWLGQVVNLAFDVELQEAHVASLIQRFSPQTMHVRLNPPTGGVSLTEHRPEILHRMEQDTRQYLAENRVVFADVAAALVENSGFARVDAAPSTPWDAPGLEDAFWDAPSAGDDARAGAAALGTSAARASVDAERRASHAAGANGVFSVSDADAAGGGSGLPAGTFESFARERDRERVTRRDAKGASVTVRRGSGAFGGDAARRRKKITASAPVAPLDRFPSFPGPGTARSAEAARRRADAARAFADTSNERTGWRRLFWGAGVKAARGAVDEDVGEVAEVQPLREQVALGEVPDVDTSSRRSRRRDSRETTKTRVRGETTSRGAREGAAVGAASARAAGESASPPGARPVSAKSWLDEGAESVSGWDDDASFATGDAEEAKASKGAEEANEARARPTARAPSATPSADAESASDAR